MLADAGAILAWAPAVVMLALADAGAPAAVLSLVPM